MKTYNIRKDVKRKYDIVGVCAIIIATVAFAFQTAHFRVILYNDIFYIGAFAVAVLLLKRGKKCQLCIDEEEIYFTNGMLDHKHIALNDIELIEYHPQIRIRIYMKKKGSKEIIYRIPNVFSKEDTEEILHKVQTKRRRIKVSHIERPTMSLKKQS